MQIFQIPMSSQLLCLPTWLLYWASWMVIWSICLRSRAALTSLCLFWPLSQLARAIVHDFLLGFNPHIALEHLSDVLFEDIFQPLPCAFRQGGVVTLPLRSSLNQQSEVLSSIFKKSPSWIYSKALREGNMEMRTRYLPFYVLSCGQLLQVFRSMMLVIFTFRGESIQVLPKSLLLNLKIP